MNQIDTFLTTCDHTGIKALVWAATEAVTYYRDNENSVITGEPNVAAREKANNLVLAVDIATEGQLTMSSFVEAFVK